MAETEKTTEPVSQLRVAPDPTAADVQECFQDAFADRQEFSSVMILAVVDDEEDSETQYVRVYSTPMGHLEKIGLAEKAKRAIE